MKLYLVTLNVDYNRRGRSWTIQPVVVADEDIEARGEKRIVCEKFLDHEGDCYQGWIAAPSAGDALIIGLQSATAIRFDWLSDKIKAKIVAGTWDGKGEYE